MEAIDFEGAVLDAIKEAHVRNLQVIGLGLPLIWQQAIIDNNAGNFSKGDRLKELFGVPVKITRIPQIMTEISFLRPLKGGDK